LDNQVIYDYALDILSNVFDNLNNGFNFHTHAGGVAGIGTIIEILTDDDLIDANTDELFEGLDEYLYQLMISELQKGNYDFLHGAIGLGLFFSKRLSNKNSSRYLTDFVIELDRISKKDDQGIRWLSVLNREKNKKGFNLSLSHGLASIITFLSKLYALGIAKEKVSELLNGSVKYLLNQQQDISMYKSNFPTWVCQSEPSTYSRLAWCYGDLGIGIALWQAGCNTDNKIWKKRGIKILLHSTKRRDLTENSVVDAGLCHGTSGIAHIYNRMFHYTGKEEFRDSASYWYKETLKMAKFEDGLAGYKAWRSPKYGGWQKEYCFLVGISGIGLTLISAVSNIEPKWDECLLLS
jgi:lantibiotic modifying enzyme